MQEVTTSTARKTVVSLVISLMLVLAMVLPASAQVEQDGLVNVNIGDVTILEDVNIAIAALVAANICGVDVGPVAVLGQAVDASGDTETVCTNRAGRRAVTISQN